jgi:flagella basal body P-ring formation protein FlgA
MKAFNYRLDIAVFSWIPISFLVAFVLLTGICCESAAADLTRIRILDHAEIDEENILLGKISKIEGGDPGLTQKLVGIVIGNAPLPGKSRKLEERIIIMRLKQHGIDLTEVELRVPPKVVITRSSTKISADEVKLIVSDFLSKELLTGKGETRIKEIRVSGDLSLPGGRITYEVEPPRNKKMMGKIPISVNFKVNGKSFKRVWATATIEVFAEVVVTKKPLGRYKPITEDDIEMQKRDLMDLPSNVITDPEMVLGKRTKRAIGAKAVLRANLVEFPPLVRRGDIVVIVAESKGLKITALGQVKKKGGFGERIPVINFDSKKILYARVVDSSTVRVEF